MELGAEERLVVVDDALVGVVVGVDKQLLPVRGQCRAVDGEPVVLRTESVGWVAAG